jgi:hypothetical protein
MDWGAIKTFLHANDTRISFPVYGNSFSTWIAKSHNYKQSDRGYKRNRHDKYLLAIKALCLSALSVSVAAPVNAETVGGVSATASPVANSSGSVTNQAIQVLQGPYITNTYGGGIQCQGPTRNFTPYVTGSASASKPYEDYYNDPVYDISDNFGAFDDDGNAVGDGIIDNPGDILFHKRTRTGQKDNYSLGVGFSMTWSTPTDKKLQELCKEAAASNIEMMKQLTANKRLDFEIARLKNCGQLMKDGISFHPRSPYYKISADVVVQNVNTIQQHNHSIPVAIPITSSSSDSSPQQTEALQSLHSEDAALLGVPLQIQPLVSSPE